MDVGELVGLMLGAQPHYAVARIAVERSGRRAADYHVTVLRGTDWTIRRGRLTHRVSPNGTTVERDGVVIDSGPPMRFEGEAGVFLLMPRYALIFGRPGEDWRLTEDVTEHVDGVRVTLRHVEHDDCHGSALVDPTTGMLRELVLDDTTWRLTELSTEPPA